MNFNLPLKIGSRPGTFAMYSSMVLRRALMAMSRWRRRLAIWAGSCDPAMSASYETFCADLRQVTWKPNFANNFCWLTSCGEIWWTKLRLKHYVEIVGLYTGSILRGVRLTLMVSINQKVVGFHWWQTEAVLVIILMFSMECMTDELTDVFHTSLIVSRKSCLTRSRV